MTEQDENRTLSGEEPENETEERIHVSKLKVALLALFLLALPLLYYFGVGFPINLEGVNVGSISVQEDGYLNVPLTMNQSALAFTITTQQQKDGDVIIKPRASLVGLHKSGSTVVRVKVPLEDLGRLYLQGDDENERILLWDNTDGAAQPRS